MIVDFGGAGGRRLFETFYSCKKMFCVVSKMMERFEKKQYGLKMFMSMEYLSILHEKNLLRVSRNQPSLPL